MAKLGEGALKRAIGRGADELASVADPAGNGVHTMGGSFWVSRQSGAEAGQTVNVNICVGGSHCAEQAARQDVEAAQATLEASKGQEMGMER